MSMGACSRTWLSRNSRGRAPPLGEPSLGAQGCPSSPAGHKWPQTGRRSLAALPGSLFVPAGAWSQLVLAIADCHLPGIIAPCAGVPLVPKAAGQLAGLLSLLVSAATAGGWGLCSCATQLPAQALGMRLQPPATDLSLPLHPPQTGCHHVTWPHAPPRACPHDPHIAPKPLPQPLAMALS